MKVKYRQFEIEPESIIGCCYFHEDYDGPEDRRAGYGRTQQECKDAVDEWWTEQTLEAVRKVRSVHKVVDDIMFSIAVNGAMSTNQGMELDRHFKWLRDTVPEMMAPPK